MQSEERSAAEDKTRCYLSSDSYLIRDDNNTTSYEVKSSTQSLTGGGVAQSLFRSLMDVVDMRRQGFGKSVSEAMYQALQVS